MSTTETISKSIRLLMRDQGKSNRELANLIGCNQNQASRIVNAKAEPGMEELFMIARWLGATTDQLARGYELTPVQMAA